MEIFLIPIGVTIIIVTLTLLSTYLGMRLNHMRNKMRWWRNEACRQNSSLRYLWKKKDKKKDYMKHTTRAPWQRKNKR